MWQSRWSWTENRSETLRSTSLVSCPIRGLSWEAGKAMGEPQVGLVQMLSAPWFCWPVCAGCWRAPGKTHQQYDCSNSCDTHLHIMEGNLRKQWIAQGHMVSQGRAGSWLESQAYHTVLVIPLQWENTLKSVQPLVMASLVSIKWTGKFMSGWLG